VQDFLLKYKTYSDLDERLGLSSEEVALLKQYDLSENKSVSMKLSDGSIFEFRRRITHLVLSRNLDEALTKLVAKTPEEAAKALEGMKELRSAIENEEIARAAIEKDVLAIKDEMATNGEAWGRYGSRLKELEENEKALAEIDQKIGLLQEQRTEMATGNYTDVIFKSSTGGVITLNLNVGGKDHKIVPTNVIVKGGSVTVETGGAFRGTVNMSDAAFAESERARNEVALAAIAKSAGGGSGASNSSPRPIASVGVSAPFHSAAPAPTRGSVDPKSVPH